MRAHFGLITGPRRLRDHRVANVAPRPHRRNHERLAVVYELLGRIVFAVVGPAAELRHQHPRVFLGQQPTLHAGRLHRYRRQHRQRFGPPVRVAHGRHAERKGIRIRRRIDEPVRNIGHDRLHLRRVIDAESLAVGAQQADRIGVPRFVTRFAQNPIDNGLLGPRGGGDAECVGSNIVLAPHLALILRQRTAALGDAGPRDSRIDGRESTFDRRNIARRLAVRCGSSARLAIGRRRKRTLLLIVGAAVAATARARCFPATVVLRSRRQREHGRQQRSDSKRENAG